MRERDLRDFLGRVGEDKVVSKRKKKHILSPSPELEANLLTFCSWVAGTGRLPDTPSFLKFQG